MGALRESAPPPILRRLLEAAGYRLEDRSGATVAFRAVDHRAVVLVSGPSTARDIESLFPTGSVHRSLVFDEDPGAAVRAAAAAAGVEVLDPMTLGPALGEILLPSALVPGAATSEASDELLDRPFPLSAGGGRIVRPRIARGEAQVLAGLADARYTLRLVPYYVAAYRVRTVAPDGGPGPVRRRLVAVNATSRRAEIWDEGSRELVHEVEGPAERLDPQLSENGAVGIALEAVRREHTVRVDHTEQHGGALVVESRRVAPAGEAVRLGPFVLLYVPFWYAESSDGRRVLDAVSGRGPRDPELRAG